MNEATQSHQPVQRPAVTKKQAILDYLSARPEAKLEEVARALETTKKYVSFVSSSRRKPARRSPGRARFKGTTRYKIELYLTAHPIASLNEVAQAVGTTKGYVSVVKRDKASRISAASVHPPANPPSQDSPRFDFKRWPLLGYPNEHERE